MHSTRSLLARSSCLPQVGSYADAAGERPQFEEWPVLPFGPSPVFQRAEAILAARAAGEAEDGSEALKNGAAVFVKLPPNADAKSVEAEAANAVQYLLPALGFDAAKQVRPFMAAATY